MFKKTRIAIITAGLVILASPFLMAGKKPGPFIGFLEDSIDRTATGDFVQIQAGGKLGNASAAGGGDVTAASNYGTDNVVIRSDGTSKGTQASGVSIDDSDNVTGIGSLTATTLTDGTATITGGHAATTSVSATYIGGASSYVYGDGSNLTNVGSGDVSAAANITDNAVVRGDGGAKGVQESTSVTIDDSDNLAGVALLTTANTTATEGATADWMVLTGSSSGNVDLDVNGDASIGGTATVGTLTDGTATITGGHVDTTSVSATSIGDTSTVLYGDGSNLTGVSGSGDVTAAANMTDNTIVRGDGGAKGVQDTGWTIDDSDAMSGTGSLAADTFKHHSDADNILDMSNISGNAVLSTSTTVWTADGSTSDFTVHQDLNVSNNVSVTTGLSADFLTATDSVSSARYQFADGTAMTTAGGGSGDVTAASSFGTDNVLIRSDGTGKGVQSTGIVVDDSDNVSMTADASADSLVLTGASGGNVDLVVDGESEFNGELTVNDDVRVPEGGLISIGGTTNPYTISGDAGNLVINGTAGTNGVLRIKQTSGTSRLQLDSTALGLNTGGSAATPSIRWSTDGGGDPDTGIYHPSADNLGFSTGGTAALTLDSNQDVSIPAGDLTVSAGDLSVSSGTMASATDHIFDLTVTMPSAPSASAQAVDIDVTSAGSASQEQHGMAVDLLAGYTGSSSTKALQATNQTAGTGTGFWTLGAYNMGFDTRATGATATGQNNAVRGIAYDSQALNVGVFGAGYDFVAGTPDNIGVVGLGRVQTGENSHIGGFFHLRSSLAAPSGLKDAALIADNGDSTDPAFIAQDNGTDVFTIADGGDVTMAVGDFTVDAGYQALNAGYGEVMVGTDGSGNATVTVNVTADMPIGNWCPDVEMMSDWGSGARYYITNIHGGASSSFDLNIAGASTSTNVSFSWAVRSGDQS